MAFSKYNRERPFLVINRRSKPSDGENTSSKNWGETAKWQVDEEIIIVDRVTNKHIMQATVIIDILQRKMVKNRYGSESDDATVLKHYLSTYKAHITDGIETWMKNKTKDKAATEKLANDVQDELDKIRVEIKTDEKTNTN